MSEKNEKAPRVAILMGSKSDWPQLQAAAETLKSFDVPFEARVLSAHRTPEEAAAFSRGAETRGVEVILAAAGGAAHLAGVLAAHTIRPVIGIPVQGGALNGLDALLATVQMPGGIPVATVAVGKAGAVNAALLAVEIMAVHDAVLAKKMHAYKQTMRQNVLDSDAALQKEIQG